MTLSLRHRILLLFLPTLILLIGIGAAGVGMLENLGRRSEEILRENVVSLRAMFQLHQSLTDMERLVLWSTRDSKPLHSDIRRSLNETALRAREACKVELDNITLPGEREEAEALNRFLELAIRRGESILEAPPDQRWNLYLDPGQGFQHTVTLAWQRLGRIWEMNEDAVYDADRRARDTARQSVITLTVAVALGCLFSLATGWWLQRTLLGPIRSVTEAATAIGGGQLDLMVPVPSQDELGQLAGAFNAMTSKLRVYRQSNLERLLRARQTGQATIDSFADPVVVIDTLGRVEIANPAAQRLLGVRPPTDTEPSVWLPPESLRQPIDEALRQQRVIENETFDQTLSFRLDDDERVYLPQVRPIRSAEGELLGAAVVLNDVTRFRLLDRLKSDWVATVSHELKTPLTSVRLVVHLLLEEVVGPLEPKQVELLIEARENTERLLKLIEYLLALARLEDGREQLDLRNLEPAELLQAAADEATTRAESKRIAVNVDVAPETAAVCVDPIRFGRALGNLLDNAITYTEPGGTITLSAANTATGFVSLTVRDTGIGIPADSLPHVFDRFFRVPDRDNPPGTGLGLAIVREIVAAHGGEITCNSEVDRGTTFHITLPTAKEAT